MTDGIKRDTLSPRLDFYETFPEKHPWKGEMLFMWLIPLDPKTIVGRWRVLVRGKNDCITDCILTIPSKQPNTTISDSICIVLVSLVIQRLFKVCRKKCKGTWQVLCLLI